MRKFFDGIESYSVLARRAVPPIFIGSAGNQAVSDAEFMAWKKRHDVEIKAALKAQQDYFAESFALANLCGSVLQVAAKYVDLFSKVQAVPPDWIELIKPDDKRAKYCVGKRVRTVPLGLVILAGRNQHMHFGEEKPLNKVNVEVFHRLAVHFRDNTDPAWRDPAFDLANGMLVSFAHNITALIGWRSYEAYEKSLPGILEACPDA